MRTEIQKFFFLFALTMLIGIACKKEKSCENCGVHPPDSINKFPIANAGTDQTINLPTDSVMLDGSASSDPDGTISSFQWTKISGPASFTINNVSAAITAVKNIVAGTYRFELKVTDNGGLSAKDTVQIMVDDPSINQPPIANAGPDQTITLPTNSVNLDGSGSADPDNNIISYAWTKIAGPSSFNIANANTIQTPVTNLVQGVYQFELKVTDAGALFSKDTVQVTVNNPVNHPPVANAGADQTITLPTNTVNLDGSGSTDPDNNIVSYLWTIVQGPPSYTIVNPNAAQTQVTNLAAGVYKFELKVTDAGNLFSKDTIQVTVIVQPPPPTTCDNNRPLINAQLVPVGALSQVRDGIAVAAAGNKIIFAGGFIPPGTQSSRVDIYNLTTQTWSTAELGTARNLIATVVSGNKIFFGGGETSDGTWPVDWVDIYDATTNTWSVSHLSTAGHSIAAAAVADKVLFAGGDGGFTGTGRETRVDIYNLTTNSWSTSSLSEVKRGEHAAVTLNNKIYFAGGETWPSWPNGNWGASNKIDIYDHSTNTWSASFLSQGKMSLTGIASGNKIYWAGGQTGFYPSISLTCSVEIMDINTNTSSIQYMFNPASWSIASGENAVLKNDKIIYYRPYAPDNNKFDIYNITTNTWSIGSLTQPIPEGASIISVNNIIYVAGGYVNGVPSNQVWKLEF